MLQPITVLLCCVACVLAGYPEHTSGNELGNSDGYGYGYSGSYSGTGNPPENFNFPPFDFSSFFSNLQQFQDNLQKTPNGNAHASSSITFSRKGILSNSGSPGGNSGAGAYGYSGQGQGFGGGYGGRPLGGGYQGQGFGGSFSGGIPGGGGFQFIPSGASGFGADGDGASAFGSIGPGGIQQKASVFPDNPNSPNVNVRFGGSDTPNGFKSVFTSSSSVTTNEDGQPKTVKQATTTVNDNGKVTTYTAKSP